MKTSHFFGYLLGLLIFVIGIPALMWLVSGRPWPYAPDSTLLCVVSVLFAICGLVLSIYSIVYMRIVGKGNPFDAYGHEVAPRTRHLMTGGPYGLCRIRCLSAFTFTMWASFFGYGQSCPYWSS